MKKEKTTVNGRASGLVKALYVIAAILMLVWVYMIIVNIMYINNYTATYGISVSDMMMDSVQYVVTGSISYFIYGVLVFCAGKIIRLLQRGGREEASEAGGLQASVGIGFAEAIQDGEVSASGEPNAAEEAGKGNNDEEACETGEIPDAAADEKDGRAVQAQAGDIPESEDAVEETEVIEDEDKK